MAPLLHGLHYVCASGVWNTHARRVLCFGAMYVCLYVSYSGPVSHDGSTMLCKILNTCTRPTTVLIVVDWVYEKVVGPPPSAARYLKVPVEEGGNGFDTALEMAPVMKIRE